MKKLLFAIAGAAAFATFAADPTAQTGDIDVLGFENFNRALETVTGAVVNRDDYGLEGLSKWVSTGEDSSYVTNHLAAPSITEPKLFAAATALDPNANSQYLALDTEGSELQRYFTTETTNGTPTAVAPNGTYIDTLVQFTVTEDEAPAVNDAKLAIWMGVENGATNLCVTGGYYWDLNGEPQAGSNKVYHLSGTYEPSTWYRLTVEARDISTAQETVRLLGFVIRINGNVVAASEGVYDSSLSSVLSSFTASADKELLDENKFIPTIASDFSTAPTLTCVGFQGTGAIDDFVVTTVDPFPPAVIDFTLTWDEGVSAVSYVLSTDLATTNGLTSGTAVRLAPGDGTATIELIPTFATDYEFDKVTMGETELSTLTFAIPSVTTNAMLVAKAAATYPTYIDTTDATIKAKYDAWKNTYQADTQSAWETAFLLNMDPTESVASGTALLKIASITEVDGGWELEIASDATTLTAVDGTSQVGNGYLAITYAADLATLTSGGTTVNLPVTVTSGKITVTVSASGAKFMKAELTSTQVSQASQE